MLKSTNRRPGSPPRRGLSLVELLVGAVIGLLVVGGALSLFARNVIGSRQMLAEVRVNQDLRAATDLLTRDIRRAGYWGNAIDGTIAIGATSTTTQNPYTAVASPSGQQFDYAFSNDTAENNLLDSGERFGLRLSAGVLQLQTADGVWADLTDPQSVTITAFSITPVSTTLPLGQFCMKPCAPGILNCPTTTVRRVDVVLSGRSARDATLQRSLRSSVRLRNDRLAGTCPP